MDRKEIENDTLVRSWLDGLDAAQTTRRTYIKSLFKYCKFTGLLPTALVEEAESEIEAGTLMRKQKLKQNLIGFRTSVKEAGAAPKTIYGNLSAVKSFYKFNDIPLPQMNNRKQFRPKGLRKNDLRLEKEQIREILKHADVRNRAIIFVMVSSGLSQIDLLDLRVKNFTDGYDEATGVTTLDVRRTKTGYDFITFLSPEAGHAVQDWIDLRNRNPDTPDGKKDYEKNRIRSGDDYLFTSKNINDSYLETLDDKERKLHAYGLMDSFRQIAQKAGMETEKGAWSLVRAHNFRKFFNTTLLNNGADIFTTDYLMGHTIAETHAAYFKADPVKFKEKYMKFIPFLSIEDTQVKTVESMEYQELKQNYTAMCAEVEELKVNFAKREKTIGAIVDDPEILDKLKRLLAKENQASP
jgi:integrase